MRQEEVKVLKPFYWCFHFLKFFVVGDEPPIGGQTTYWMPNNHLSYIFTWYSLTAALLVFLKKGAF